MLQGGATVGDKPPGYLPNRTFSAHGTGVGAD